MSKQKGIKQKGIKNGVITDEVFDFLKENCPDFLKSYSILSQFYLEMTKNYVHKKWKDGRIVLTPKAKEDEKSSD